MSRVRHERVHASSMDMSPSYPSPIDDYCRVANQAPTGLEWVSAKSCGYPQELGLCLPQRACIKTIRLATHSAYAPSRVELLIGDDTVVATHYLDPASPEARDDLPLHLYFSTDCRPLCTVEWREATAVDGAEEMRVDVHEPLNVLKLIVHGPRSRNVYNQVAIMQLDLLGVEMTPPTGETKAQGTLARKVSMASIQRALLETGVPMDVVTDLGAPPAAVDEYTRKAIASVLLVKADCIASEAYAQAQILSEHVRSLSSLGQQMQSLSRLKSNTIANEDYDAALTYHEAMAALHTTRERAIAKAFASCQPAPAIDDDLARDVPDKMDHERTASGIESIFDLAVRAWRRDDPGHSPLKGSDASSTSRPALPPSTSTFLNTMFGTVFVHASVHSNWRVRRACIEIAEQHIAVLVPMFDPETLYEMYSVYVDAILLHDSTVPVILALLHLVRTMYEKPSDAPTSFGTYELRRGVLRPLVQNITRQLLHFCAKFNTLLREECIRTLRFLVQQRHIADVVLEATWQSTQAATSPFETLLCLKCLQDLLYTFAAADIPLPKNKPLLADMQSFLKAQVNDASADVSGSALECLTLLLALAQQDALAVSLEVEAHVPLFRKFPFDAMELRRLTAHVETYARLFGLPTQLRTYVLDEGSLDGFESRLQKGSVAFVGSVEKRRDPVDVGSNQERVHPMLVEPNVPANMVLQAPIDTMTTTNLVSGFEPEERATVDTPALEEPSLQPTLPSEDKTAAPTTASDMSRPVDDARAVPILSVAIYPASTPVLSMRDDARIPSSAAMGSVESSVVVPETSAIVPETTVVAKPNEPAKDAKSIKKNQITPTNEVAAKSPRQTAADDKIGTLKVVDQVVTKARKASAKESNDKKGCRIS
ncbi:hypothetical protein SDRG_14149 [Saprolegnia diclina VS20]|uniref:Centrosomal protein CEP104 N-terminal domain-containing protein n=1 Tax=Saprolegnia diclina (strain VS20) TaxID=1156394 RepID=T0Q3R6_SAPDV|nr:hypothetical protein SDRG_14149 [Saprolegnia diclina VS20]EQC28055.1 hypothetical protein SDRG_14149 [Saprolegnia diclina VS20]|eukprot:XP_008618480.1 hypothetical protein SDRG_14149 [Saprolegnia diclina VS20]